MENTNNVNNATLDISKTPTLEVLQVEYINLVLQKFGGNKAKAAEVLDVSVKTIYNKLNKHTQSVIKEQG